MIQKAGKARVVLTATSSGKVIEMAKLVMNISIICTNVMSSKGCSWSIDGSGSRSLIITGIITGNVKIATHRPTIVMNSEI